MQLNFTGQLLSAKTGTNAPEYGGAPYTVLEFSPVEGQTFTLRADGHLDVSKIMRRDIDWSLGVEPKVSQGKVSFKVVKVATNGKAEKA